MTAAQDERTEAEPDMAKTRHRGTWIEHRSEPEMKDRESSQRDGSARCMPQQRAPQTAHCGGNTRRRARFVRIGPV